MTSPIKSTSLLASFNNSLNRPIYELMPKQIEGLVKDALSRSELARSGDLSVSCKEIQWTFSSGQESVAAKVLTLEARGCKQANICFQIAAEIFVKVADRGVNREETARAVVEILERDKSDHKLQESTAELQKQSERINQVLEKGCRLKITISDDGNHLDWDVEQLSSASVAELVGHTARAFESLSRVVAACSSPLLANVVPITSVIPATLAEPVTSLASAVTLDLFGTYASSIHYFALASIGIYGITLGVKHSLVKTGLVSGGKDAIETLQAEVMQLRVMQSRASVTNGGLQVENQEEKKGEG